MKNFDSFLNLISKMGNVPSPPAAAAATAAAYIKPKKYEPSQHQVDLLYAEMVEAYEKSQSRWYGADKEILLSMFISKLRKEHPYFFLPPPPSNTDASSAVAISTSFSSSPKPKEKKRKVGEECGPILFSGFRVSKDVFAHILPYVGDRSSINNLSLASKSFYRTIYHDRKVVPTIPWPCRCPWPKSRPVPHGFKDEYDGFVVESRDKSLLAVCRRLLERRLEGSDRLAQSHNLYHIEFWDQFHGLIGELEWRQSGYLTMKPVFSPDSQLLLVPLTEKDAYTDEENVVGIRAVQIPPGPERGPVTVTCHNLGNGQVSSVTYVNQNTIAVAKTFHRDDDDGGFDNIGDGGIELWEINNRENNDDGSTVGLTYLYTILEDEFRGYGMRIPNVASFTWKKKTFLAIVPDEFEEKIIFYDLARNKSLWKTNSLGGAIRDVSFTNNGKLVVAHGNIYPEGQQSSGNIYTYDCKVDTIEEIGQQQPHTVSINSDGVYHEIISFSADDTRVVVEFIALWTGARQKHLIDLQTKTVLSVSGGRAGPAWDNLLWSNCL